jgi:hypothetical protein
MKLSLLVLPLLVACVPNPTATAVDSVKLEACIVTDAAAGKSVAQISIDCATDLVTTITTLAAKAPTSTAAKEAEVVRAKLTAPSSDAGADR